MKMKTTLSSATALLALTSFTAPKIACAFQPIGNHRYAGGALRLATRHHHAVTKAIGTHPIHRLGVHGGSYSMSAAATGQ